MKLLKSEYMSKDHLEFVQMICFQATYLAKVHTWLLLGLKIILVPNYWLYHHVHKFKRNAVSSSSCVALLLTLEEDPGLEWPVSLLRKRASGWAGLSPCSGRGPWNGLAYLPTQDWPIFLIRKRVPD